MSPIEDPSARRPEHKTPHNGLQQGPVVRDRRHTTGAARGVDLERRPPGSPAKVMIVEDQGVVAMHVANTVRSWGYTVSSVSATADAAIRSSVEDPPDLVLMDIGLKGDTDGIEAAKAIRQRHDVPVVYLTAYRDEDTLERAKETEPYGYALKPINETELKIIIEIALAKHQADRTLKRREQWLDATLSSAGEAIIATDADGRVRFVNERAESLTGWSGGEARSKDITEVLAEPQSDDGLPTEHFVRRVLRKHSVITRGRGAELLNRNGDRIPIDDCASPIRDADGRVTGAIVIFRDATERRKADARLIHMAHHDALTDLPNRVLFQQRLSQAIAHARRNRTLVAVLLLDLDRFKVVNDTLGHSAGDSLLVAASQRVRDCVRETDTVARLGGDEIAVIQTELDDEAGAAILAGKLVRAFNQPFSIGGHEVTTTVSIGITVFPVDEKDPAEMLRRADTAMYRAKAAGRNRFDISSRTSGEAPAGIGEISETDLRRAIDGSELEVYLQPIFDLGTGRPTGAEALIRWNHPTIGLVSAGRFLQAAEHFGVSGSIVGLSLSQACAAARTWLAERPNLGVSVNLLDSDLHRSDLVTLVATILEGASLTAEQLSLEIGERSPLESDRPVVSDNLLGLRDLGVQITLDGFGRKIGSMLTMTTQPIRCVKIDRAVVRRIPCDRRATGLVRATVEIADAFDLTVVAVGVENDEQRQTLRDAGCHRGQGNLLASPMSTRDFHARYVM